ncbi:MAG: XF1762 family protein [Christensenellales bacterium]
MLELRPVHFREACAFIGAYHRHHKPPVGHKFSLACYEDDRLCGVATVGRPVSRYLDDGLTLEVNRLCTDGTKNACSLLYSASWRAARALGYKRIYTYTLASEGVASLRAAGWVCQGAAGGANWTGGRERQTELFPEMKTRWMKGAER